MTVVVVTPGRGGLVRPVPVPVPALVVMVVAAGRDELADDMMKFFFFKNEKKTCSINFFWVCQKIVCESLRRSIWILGRAGIFIDDPTFSMHSRSSSGLWS